MKQFWNVFIFGLVLVGATTDTLQAQAHFHYTKTTVCRVLSLEMAYRPLYVEIKADVMADHRHVALLIDNKCPHKGLFLGVSPENADPSVNEFNHILWSDGPPDFSGRILSGTFFGKLQVDGPLALNSSSWRTT